MLFNPVQQSKNQVVRAYYPTIYTVVSLEKIFSEEKSFMNLCGIDKRSLKIPWEWQQHPTQPSNQCTAVQSKEMYKVIGTLHSYLLMLFRSSFWIQFKLRTRSELLTSILKLMELNQFWKISYVPKSKSSKKSSKKNGPKSIKNHSKNYLKSIHNSHWVCLCCSSVLCLMSFYFFGLERKVVTLIPTTCQISC